MEELAGSVDIYMIMMLYFDDLWLNMLDLGEKGDMM